MAIQEIGSETLPAKHSTMDVRAELYRIIEEIGTAREDRARTLRARFDELWEELRVEGGEETVH
jgi:hypothetical protein